MAGSGVNKCMKYIFYISVAFIKYCKIENDNGKTIQEEITSIFIKIYYQCWDYPALDLHTPNLYIIL